MGLCHRQDTQARTKNLEIQLLAIDIVSLSHGQDFRKVRRRKHSLRHQTRDDICSFFPKGYGKNGRAI